MSFSVACKHDLDPALLWLWCRPGASALIGPLAWELPYATGTAVKRKKKNFCSSKLLLEIYHPNIQKKEKNLSARDVFAGLLVMPKN